MVLGTDIGRLVLGRKVGESIDIAEGEIIITVVKLGPKGVRLLIEAPRDIPIRRTEVANEVDPTNA